MTYKAIIFDIDGTAIPNRSSGMPSQKLIKAIQEAQDSIKLCAATGRSITMAKDILFALKLKEPCVISGGTQIINPLTGEILWEITIAPEVIKEILKICRPYQYEILVKNELIGEGGPSAARTEIEEDVNIVYIIGCAKDDAINIFAELEKVPIITASGVPSWTREAVDIHVTHKDATKEHAVSELLRILKLNKNEVIGVGDADNDVHLFTAVGYKVAMGNSTEKLKALADEITDSVDNDGLANIIRKYR